MVPSTAGRVLAECDRVDRVSAGRADGASAGRADGASAGQADGAPTESSIPEGVPTGPPNIRHALLAASPDDGHDAEVGRYKRTQRLIRRVRALELTQWHRDHPGQAPYPDPLFEYFLFPPGVDKSLDLANPARSLAAGCVSYKVVNLNGHDVKVQLAKRCFEILASPPPVEGCVNSINGRGILTVGFGTAIDEAWFLVLKVVGKSREHYQRPLALAANSVSRASAGTSEVEAPGAAPEPVASPGESKRQRTGGRYAVSVATAIDHACIGREWVRGNSKLEGAAAAPAPGPTPEANPSSSSQGPAAATDAASTNPSQGGGFPADEGGGHDATHLERDLFGGGETTGSSEDESDGPADGASAGSILRLCGTHGHHCLANTGGQHRGRVQIRKMHLIGKMHLVQSPAARRGEWEVLVCEATGEVMNTPMLAGAYNLDPEQQAELYHLQRVCPDALPGYVTSDDEDDYDQRLVRLQSGTTTINTTSCRAEVLRLWSEPFLMRSVIAVWAHQCEVGYNERIIDLSIVPQDSYIREYRFARKRSERLACRNNSIQNMRHARLRCVEIMPAAEPSPDSLIEEQRRASAVLEAALVVQSPIEIPLAPLFRELMKAKEAIALQEAQLLLLAGRESTSGATAVARTTEAFTKFCEFVHMTWIDVLQDDDDGAAV